MNCKTGDIAVIVKDFPGCESNLGRLVRVHKTGKHPSYSGVLWVIVPLDDSPLALRLNEEGPVTFEQVLSEADRVLHPDAWLQPIRSPAIHKKAKAVKEVSCV